MASTNEQLGVTMRRAFPSDLLLDFLELISAIVKHNPQLKKVLPSLVRVVLVIDAWAVHHELIFRLRTREKANARSSVSEAIQAGVVIAIAPTFIDTEVEKYVPEIARRCRVTENKVREEWCAFRSLIRICESKSRPRAAELRIDPKDAPYARLRADFDADAVYTGDPHFSKMGVPVVTIKFDTLARDYSRAKAFEIGVTLASGFTVSVSVELFIALLKGCVAFWQRLSPAIKAIILAGLAVAVIHPKSRRFLADKFRVALFHFQKYGRPVLSAVLPLVLECTKVHQELRTLEGQIGSAVPPRKRSSAIAVTRRICLGSELPLSLEEIEARMSEAGYVSKSKNFRAYLSRLLRADQDFIETADGHWALKTLGRVV